MQFKSSLLVLLTVASGTSIHASPTVTKTITSPISARSDASCSNAFELSLTKEWRAPLQLSQMDAISRQTLVAPLIWQLPSECAAAFSPMVTAGVRKGMLLHNRRTCTFRFIPKHLWYPSSRPKRRAAVVVPRYMGQSWKPLLESYCTPTVLLQVLSALPTSNMTCFYLNLFAGSCPPFVAGHNKQSINSSDGAEPRENWIDGLKTVSAPQKHIYFDSIDGKDSKLMLCAVGRSSSARGFDDCVWHFCRHTRPQSNSASCS
ncbi:hypothetical protein B0H14DRAFT_2566286 [Mycena olivaceomarginata]|nr:hypothetical protein B0H14DRAFT_2566286 [Mycena olivaceomarginata]